MSVFIYFKANAADNAKVLASIRAHRDSLLAQGIVFGFWRRTDPEAAGISTWMETYEVGNRSMESLQACIDASALASGLAALAQGSRHVERFERVDP
ncbi:MAG: DUF4936 family protein [Myxococcales bacterium]|nr:DUF4936 family protein [Myxococcales bacterium]